ncbi:MAG: GNAT family N-acetyltransferase, partial [Chitinophagaceae bacterium]
MRIIEVTDASTAKKFLDVARCIYEKDPLWVCPLDKDISSVFDPSKNNFHQFGEATRWILISDDGSLIGRIAAFINKKKAFNYEVPTGGCGFYECINDDSASRLLFDTAKSWLEQRGMKAMDGPINFGENDMWWGLLIDGFTKPYYGMNYNPPYYREQFENYGFSIVYEQISNRLYTQNEFPERFTKIANWVANKPGVQLKNLDPHNLNKFISDFQEIYNDGWKDFTNFVPINEVTLLQSFTKMKAIMDPNLIVFAYIDQEPASFIVIVPDVNELIEGINGKLNLFGLTRFLWNKWVRKNKRMRAVVMGTKKKFQRLGLES